METLVLVRRVKPFQDLSNRLLHYRGRTGSLGATRLAWEGQSFRPLNWSSYSVLKVSVVPTRQLPNTSLLHFVSVSVLLGSKPIEVYVPVPLGAEAEAERIAAWFRTEVTGGADS